jgi:hypothetical protein
LVAVVFPLTPANAGEATPQATPQPPQYCFGIESYYDQIYSAIPSEYEDPGSMLMQYINSGVDSDTLRPSQLLELSEGLDAWATEVENIPIGDIPHVLRVYHRAWVTAISLRSSWFHAWYVGGPFAVTSYTDQAESTDRAYELAELELLARCPNAEPDPFPR